MDRPTVKPRDVISIGKAYKKAVVSNVLDNNEIEIVYMDHKRKAINENIRWNGKTWDFVRSDPCGGYADNIPRLKEFVDILKSLEKRGGGTI